MSPFALQVALHWAGVACYVAGLAAAAHAVFFQHPERARWATRAIVAGLVPHGAALVLRWVDTGRGPYILRYEVLSASAWVSLAALALFLWRRRGWSALAIVVVPAAVLAIAVGVFSPQEARDLPPTLRSGWLVFHVSFAKLALASFLLSVAAAVFVLLEVSPGRAWKVALPPLEQLDAYMIRFVGFGFLFWTFSVAAGSVWANESWGRYWGWDAVETWSLVTWLLYGALLHARLFFKLKARAAAWSVLGAFAVFVATAMVFPFLWPSFHAAYFQ